MMTRYDFNCRLAGAASGLMLAAPNMWGALAPLQAVALVPVLFVDAGTGVKKGTVFAAGMYMGLAYTLPQVVYLRLPIIITVALLVHLTVLMVLLNCGWRILLSRRIVCACLAAGAFLVVIDWFNFTAVPMWGTSQSIVRCWSTYPAAIRFVSLTGITGIVFALGTLEAAAVFAVLRPGARHALAVMASVIVLTITAVNEALRRQPASGSLKVAAVGWLSNDDQDTPDVHTDEGFDKLFAEPIAHAATQGARLVVFGEMAFHIDNHTRPEWLRRLRHICTKHDIWLAVGYFNRSADENRLLFMDPDGQVAAEYTKTCLTPFENCRRGDGQVKIVDLDGIRTGALICQDDNFTCLTRDYARKAVPLMAVPTLDWSTVKDVHLQTTVHRAVENRQAIVRAAINGTSAIIAPDGKVLARCDHFKEGPGVITAEVPLHRRKTLFAIWGNWPAICAAVFLAFYFGRYHRKIEDKPELFALTAA